METEQKMLDGFLKLHSHRFSFENARGAQLVRCASSFVPIDAPIVMYEPEDVRLALDMESPLVRWLHKQVCTYEPEREIVVGIIFDERKVLSHVLRRINSPHKR